MYCIDKNKDGRIKQGEILDFYKFNQEQKPEWARKFFQTIATDSTADLDTMELTKDSLMAGFDVGHAMLKANKKIKEALLTPFEGPNACQLPKPDKKPDISPDMKDQIAKHMMKCMDLDTDQKVHA